MKQQQVHISIQGFRKEKEKKSNDLERPKEGASLRKLEIRSKHRLSVQGIVPNDVMDVKEEPRKPSCKVCQEAFGHRP